MRTNGLPAGLRSRQKIIRVFLLLMLFALATGCSHMARPRGERWQQIGTASWYGQDFHGKPTASGTSYDMYGLSAAHNTLPLGTTVRVTNLANGRKVVIPITDRGPFVGDRILDLSYGAAQQLEMVKEGLAKVHIEVLQAPRAFTERYTVQFGAFTERLNAVTLANRLQACGYTPIIEEAFAHGRKFHRVRIGAFSSLKPARDLADSLADRGISSVVIGL